MHPVVSPCIELEFNENYFGCWRIDLELNWNKFETKKTKLETNSIKMLWFHSNASESEFCVTDKASGIMFEKLWGYMLLVLYIGKVGIGYLPRQPVEILDPPPLSKYTGIASFFPGGTPIFKGKL